MRRLLLFVLIAWTVSASAQEDLRFTRITPPAGTLLDPVTVITKDDAGFYWFGTLDGIVRYDGTNFTTYKALRSDTSSICGGVVWCVLPDRDGRLWVGSDGGLAHFDPRSGKAQRFHWTPGDPHCVPQNGRTVAALDMNGEVLVAGSGGVARFDRRTGTFDHLIDGKEIHGGIAHMLVGKDGLVWLASGRGVMRFDPRSRKLEMLGSPIADERTSDAQYVAQDAEGRIWGAFWGGGVARWDEDAHRFITYLRETHVGNPSIANIFHGVLPVVENGRTTILAASGYGLMKADPATGDSSVSNVNWTVPQEGESAVPPPSDVRCLLSEPNGQLWVGGAAGLFVAVPEHRIFRKQAHVAEGNIFRLRQQNGWLLIPSWYGQGLSAIDSTGKAITWKLPADFPDRQQSAQMSDALFMHNGNMLIATLAGLLELDPRSGKYTRLLPNADHPDIDPRMISLCAAGNNEVWIGGYGAQLLRFTPSTGALVAFGKTDGIGPLVNNLVHDGKGFLWIGNQYGISRYDEGERKRSLLSSIKIDGSEVTVPEVEDLALGEQGDLWIATIDGLFRRDVNGSFIMRGLENGMPHRKVTSLCVDAQGNAWALTPAGLTCVHPDGVLRNFTFHVTMPADAIGGIARLPDGMLALTCNTDLYRFDPRALLRDDQHAPAPTITDLHVNGAAMPILSTSIALDHTQDQLAFTFVAPHFPDRGTQYRYMLDGADRNWNTCNNGRTVNYAGLAPGRYTFKVSTGKGADERTTALMITIAPPFWRTWWFLTLATLATLALIIAVVRREAQRQLRERILKLEKERAVEAERQRIARDMHDDLGSGLTRIAILSEVAKRKPGADSASLDLVSESARELVDNLGNIVWVLDPGHDRLSSLVAYIREYAAKTVEPTGSALHISAPEQLPDMPVVEKVRRNVFLIVKEALNNLVKHAQASHVKVEITMKAHAMAISIADNGAGISSDRLFGNGLRNMRQRAQDIGGALTITSASGEGTAVQLIFPLAAVPHEDAGPESGVRS